MRIRTIKPEFWHNEDLARLPEFTRLLAIGLLNYCDDEGFFVASPALLRGELFPFSESSLSIHGALTELSRVGYVALYKGTNGRAYGHVVNFVAHQRINRTSPSRIKPLIQFSESSVSPHCILSEPSHPEQGTGNREGEGEMECKTDGPNGSAEASPPPSSSDSDLTLSSEAPKPARKPEPTDAEWMAEIRKTYSWCDVDREHAKMVAWCQANRKTASRRRFVNWLNRVEKPMGSVRKSEFGDSF
jgi:hypothetical protein